MRPLDLGNVVHWGNPLNRSKKLWLMGHQQVVPGNTWKDLCGVSGAVGYDAPFTGSAKFAPTYGRNGGFGSVNFDGSTGYCTTSLDVRNSISPGITVAWWQRAGRAYNSNVTEYIWAQQGGTATEFCCQHYQTNTWYVGFLNGTDYRVQVACSTSNWFQNAWARYVFTCKIGGASFLYCNGRQIGTNAGAASSGLTGGTLLVGARTTNFFQGQIDDLSVLSCVWNAAQVEADYLESSSGNQTTLNFAD